MPALIAALALSLAVPSFANPVPTLEELFQSEGIDRNLLDSDGAAMKELKRLHAALKQAPEDSRQEPESRLAEKLIAVRQAITSYNRLKAKAELVKEARDAHDGDTAKSRAAEFASQLKSVQAEVEAVLRPALLDGIRRTGRKPTPQELVAWDWETAFA